MNCIISIKPHSKNPYFKKIQGLFFIISDLLLRFTKRSAGKGCWNKAQAWQATPRLQNLRASKTSGPTGYAGQHQKPAQHAKAAGAPKGPTAFARFSQAAITGCLAAEPAGCQLAALEHLALQDAARRSRPQAWQWVVRRGLPPGQPPLSAGPRRGQWH